MDYSMLVSREAGSAPAYTALQAAAFLLCQLNIYPKERSIYYRLYDLSPHIFLQVVFLVNI